MFKTEYEALAAAGRGKADFFTRSPLGFFVSSMVAGMFISFGSFVAMTVGGICTAGGFALTKLLVAFAFTAALSLVVMAGCELFTGNNLTVGAAALAKTVSVGKAFALWAVCWLGNFVGSWILVAIYKLSGLATGSAAEFFAATAAAKVAIAPLPLILRAVLCNICVCLAVWCATKLKSESGKLIMIFWCILVFMVCGFEHSVANMSIIGVALVNGSVDIGGYFYNVLLATAGNMIGGIGFVALPYFIISRSK